MVGWIWKINWRGCDRKLLCPNSMCYPGIYWERPAKITKNSESWTEPRTSKIQSKLTIRPTAKFDRRPSENSVPVAECWRFFFVCYWGRDVALFLQVVVLSVWFFSARNRRVFTGMNKTWATNRISISKLTYLHACVYIVQYSQTSTWRILCRWCLHVYNKKFWVYTY